MPKDGSLYVQHPILPDYYIPPEDFARTLAKEKEAAFRQLASALGAKEVTVHRSDNSNRCASPANRGISTQMHRSSSLANRADTSSKTAQN